VETPFSKAFLERFELIRVLGEGACGVVYLARNRFLKTEVAIKALKERQQLEASRFATECAVLASLDHPGIIRVHDAGLDNENVPYLVTEYVNGSTLDLLRKEGPRDISWSLKILADVADALSHAHSKGVVHRDVKPANIFVTSDGRTKLGDFGLARNADAGASMTDSGVILGTPHYISPEAALGKKAIPASDQYAVGIMAYELLSGQRPFDAESAMGVITARLTQSAPSLAECPAAIPPRLVRVVDRMLLRNPPNRFADLAEVAKELREIATNLTARTSGRVPLVVAGEALAIAPSHSGSESGPRSRPAEPGPRGRPAETHVPLRGDSGVSGRPPPRSHTSRKVALVASVPPSRFWQILPLVIIVVGLGAIGLILHQRSVDTPSLVSSPAPEVPAPAADLDGGEVLFSDDFTGSPSKWFGNRRNWDISYGMARRVSPSRPGTVFDEWLIANSRQSSHRWMEYVLTVEMQFDSHEARTLFDVVINLQENGCADLCEFDGSSRKFRHLAGDRSEDGTRRRPKTRETRDMRQISDGWHKIRIEHRPHELAVWFDDDAIGRFESDFATGTVGLGGTSRATYRNFCVRGPGPPESVPSILPASANPAPASPAAAPTGK
jgi:serine/threonine protein kinase